MDNPKQWWSPVWAGLVLDQEAKHYKRMKNALWLFLYLLLQADREKGVLIRKLKTISLATGIKERTLRGWLSLLKRHGYIETKATGHAIRIRISKWKGLSGRPNPATQTDTILPLRVAKVCQSEETRKSQNTLHLSQESGIRSPAEKITIKRELLNIDIEHKNFFESNNNALKGFKPRTREELLAFDLALTLDDLQGLAFYLAYVKRYPESLLRRVAGEVREIPAEKIKKSRGALFNHLVKRCVRI